MDEEVKTIEEQEAPAMNDDELRGAIEEQLSKIRRQSMLLGFQVAAKTVLDKITVFERTPGNKSNNDHKRLIKDLKKFCEQGLSRTVNADGETEPVSEDETAQN
jgi:hypothetical protein